MKTGRVTLLVVGVAMITHSPSLAADAAYGEYLAAECVTCHGANTANALIPPLRSLRYEELVAKLKAYRAGTLTNPAMQSVTRMLGDTEIEALAAYFSSQP